MMAYKVRSDGEYERVLRTPERLEIDADFYRDEQLSVDSISNDNNNNNNDDDDEDDNMSEESNPTPVQPTPEDIPYFVNEWQIIDFSSGKARPPRQHEYLRLLLQNSRYASYATWIDRSQGLFKINQPEKVAALWQKVKNRHTEKEMNYNTFARGIRHYYGTFMIRTNRKYTFQFNPSQGS